MKWVPEKQDLELKSSTKLSSFTSDIVLRIQEMENDWRKKKGNFENIKPREETKDLNMDLMIEWVICLWGLEQVHRGIQQRDKDDAKVFVASLGFIVRPWRHI